MRTKLVLLLVILATHYTAWWYGGQKPAQIIEKEVVKRDVVTVIKEVVRPDGTKETKTIIKDKSKETSVSQTTPAPTAKTWMLGVSYRISEFDEQVYALNVSRRVLGPFHVLGQVDTARNIYIGLTMEF